MRLEEFLKEKPLYYTEIDYMRMPRIYEKIKIHFKSTNIIHIVGTNGKGTTGRFLATALHNLGYKTGHYTSPHILEFNERIWLDGKNVSDISLENAHGTLQNLLTKAESDSLSYFEYTTFLAMILFDECEYIVLEAGLGGRHDATAVFPKKLTLVTPIAYDHESFLGNTIEEISEEKLHAIQNNAIIASQKYEEVYTIAKKVSTEKKILVHKLATFINEKDIANIQIISKNLSLAKYLEDNLRLAITSLKFLEISYRVEDFKNSMLFGRLTRFKENILLDVGHNPLAASSIVKALKGNKYTLIYNTYKDKDYKKILQVLKPITLDVEIININEKRIETKEELQNTLKELEIEYTTFKKIDESKKYLVFGSFAVVESFIKADSE